MVQPDQEEEKRRERWQRDVFQKEEERKQEEDTEEFMEEAKERAGRKDGPKISNSTALVVGLLAGLVAWQVKGWQTTKVNVSSKDPSLFRELHGLQAQYDLVIVGAGLSGAVIAEQASSRLGLSSLVIDKRNHIGGNCYDYVEEHGIRVSQYGVHIFHTKYPRVEAWVKKFSSWVPYTHRVLGKVNDSTGFPRTVPIPPNIDTVNILFGTALDTEQDMVSWLDERRPHLSREPRDGEEMSISRVGTDLYEKIFKQYTKKQWDKWPSELDASVLARLPYRTNRDSRYFNDPFQALPKDGYTAMFENILLNNPDITVRLGLDYFVFKDHLPKHKLLVFTGPIDAFYASQGLDKLEYRSIYWHKEYLEPPGGLFQTSWVVNYPGGDVDWTRISEYKHSPNQPDGAHSLPGTVIYREYSTDVGEPYYPVPNPRNQQLYAKYQALAEKEAGVTFVGRLASYKYFNMDQAILNALELFDELVEDKKIRKKRKKKKLPFF